MKQETLRPGYQGARGYYLHAVSGRPMPLTDGMVGSSATGGITSTPSLSSVYAIDPVHLGKSQRIEELDAGLRATANRIAAVMDALNLAEMPLSSMKSKCWNFLVCWLLAFTMCLNAVPVQVRKGTAPAVRRSMGKHLSLQGVPNFGEVTPMLYRGGQPTQEGFDRLATMGIKILVDNGRSTRDGRKTKRLGMRFVSLPWYCPFPKDRVFARFLRLIKKNPDKKIFVYCRLGDDRTGMMIAAYRMAEQGWTAEQAMKEMHAFGYSPVHHLICPGLAGYEKSFPERLKKSAAFRELR